MLEVLFCSAFAEVGLEPRPSWLPGKHLIIAAAFSYNPDGSALSGEVNG